MIGRIIGNYKIVGKIGEGGMGVLYLAEHLNLPKKYAIKSLLPELTANPKFKERFREEARNQARLGHANIVQAIDYLELGNEFFFVMDYVDGQDLAHLIERRHALPEAEALGLFKGILEGLGFAHRNKVIHRDMKPSNVLIDQEQRPRITDFGIAILAGGRRLTTGSGTAVGTAWYMSREQIRRPDKIDHRTDIYSAGIILYEMLTGAVPFDGETEYVVQDKQCNARPPDPRKLNKAIGEGLVKIIFKALEKEPADRFQSCEEFLEAIRRYEQTSQAPPPPPPWRNPLLLAAFLVVLLAGLSTAAFLWWREQHRAVVPQQPPPRDRRVEEQVTRQQAALLIERATEKAELACREIPKTQRDRRNIQLAGPNFEGTAAMEKAKSRLRDYEKNIADWSAAYRDSLARLKALGADAIVFNEFEAYPSRLTEEQAIQRAPYIRLLRKHYRQSVGLASDFDESICSESQSP